MKPTSLIFLALAAVLLFTGWFTCSIASSMADAQGVSIYEQSRNKKGDIVYVYNLSDQKLSKLSLTFANVDVTIIGSAKSSYVELKNFEAYDYSTKLTGGTVSVDGTIGGLSSFIDMSGGGLRFKGLRYFFADKPLKGHKRSVTIYLSDTSSLTTLNLSLTNGDVTLKNIWNETVDYNITVREGSATFDQVTTTSVINANVSAGNVTLTNSKAKTFNTNIVGGNLSIDTTNYAAEFVSYNVKTENSTLTYNTLPLTDGQLKVVTPSDIQQCLIKVDATDANVIIKDNNTSIPQ
jgi:hypothetical protein